MIWHELTSKQLRAARMDVSGMRGVEIAKALGVSQSTVCKWRKRPAFVETVRMLQQSANEQAIEDVRLVRTAMLRSGYRLARALENTDVVRLDEDGLPLPPKPGTEVVRDSGKAASALSAMHAFFKTTGGMTG